MTTSTRTVRASSGCSGFNLVVILFLNPDYRLAIWWSAIWFLAGLAYFAFHARFRMVRSPEEQSALVEGRKEAALRQERRLA